MSQFLNVLGGGGGAAGASSSSVQGPVSATDNAIARFDGTTGKIIQNSDYTLLDTATGLTEIRSANSIKITANNGSGGFSGLEANISTYPYSALVHAGDDNTNSTHTLFQIGSNFRCQSSSGTTTYLDIFTRYNFFAGTASSVDLSVSRTEDAPPAGGSHYFCRFSLGGVPLFYVSTAGAVTAGGATPSASTAIMTPAGTTAISSVRLPHGAAPTAPVDGDIWTTTAGLFVRINGGTVGPLS